MSNERGRLRPDGTPWPVHGKPWPPGTPVTITDPASGKSVRAVVVDERVEVVEGVLEREFGLRLGAPAAWRERRRDIAVEILDRLDRLGARRG